MSDGELVGVLAVVMAVGAVGTVVPLLPGLGLIWLAGLVYGVDHGFGATGVAAFGAMTLLGVVATVAGYVVPQRRASTAGATRSSILLGVTGAVVGFFVVPIVGLPLGGVVGIYAGEHLRTRDAAAAWQATRATIVGFGVATLIQFLAALAMIAIWIGWVVAS